MTDRLYYHDSYLTEFEANVVESREDGRRVYLDRTAFYPSSGGQPFDLGELSGTAVVNIEDDEDGRIAHVLAEPLDTRAVAGRIDWARRFDHMQQHSGQHLLSAVFQELLGPNTLSFHLGAVSASIDLDCSALDAAQVRSVEERANQLVFENRPVRVSFEEAAEAAGLRKPSKREGLLRIISIENLDRSACGGTHVRATGEIGPILIRKLEHVRGSLRVEFLCGLRAVRRASVDYQALGQVARAFSVPLDDAPRCVAAQIEKTSEAEKTCRRLSLELASARGRDRYNRAAPASDGIRREVLRAATLSEELRAEAQSFAGAPKATLLALAENPPAVLLAASSDSGIHAGTWLKTELTAVGGRGGGSASLAQGSVPSRDALERIERAFLRK